MISNEQLAAWERIANEATPGPWLTYSQAKKVLNVHWNDWFSILAYNENGKPFILCSSNGAMTTDKAKEEARLKEGLPEPEGQTKCDMAFIAAARIAMPKLLAEVHSLKRELAYQQEKRESIDNLYRHVLGECHKCVNERGLLEEQADVLARKLAEFGQCTANDPHDCFHAKDCINCWREYAQKAVENG